MNHNNNDKTAFDAADIERYLNGQMSAKEMHALERAAMEDEFLADAIEGYGNKAARGEVDVAEDLQNLSARIKKRTESPNKKVIPIYNRQWWKIAAMVLLIAGSVLIIYDLTISGTGKTEIAKSATREQKILPNDSLTAATSTITDTVALAGAEKENKQPAFVPGKNLQPVQKPAATNSAKTITPAPVLALKDKTANEIVSQNDSLADVASVSRELRKSAMQSKEVMASSKQESFYKTKPLNIFSGKVVNQNNQPVSNADLSLRLNKIDTTFLTDSNGYFKFTLPDTMASIAINKVGFDTSIVNLRGNVAGTEITLNKNNQQLNDVVVIGYGAKKKDARRSEEPSSEIREATPVIGLEAYNRYIETNKKTPVQLSNLHGEVVISFFVSKKGRPGNIKIEKSLSRLLDEEAIRLIKQGPAWNVLKNKRSKATITVNF